jgi:hypothetical protein
MFRRLALAAACLALLGAGPAFAQQGGADREFSRLNADQAHRLGLQHYRTNNFDQALRQFERAVALAPDVDNYRRSLALTKQRISIEQAKQRTLRDNAERSRRALGSGNADEGQFEGAGQAPLPTAPAPRDISDPLGSDAARRQPVTTRGAPREPDNAETAVRPPDLGGDAMQRESPLTGGLPSDLPVAGSFESSLPIGRLPDELFRAPERRRAADAPATETTEDGSSPTAILPESLFPSLFSTAPRDAESGQAPRLDTPGTLP